MHGLRRHFWEHPGDVGLFGTKIKTQSTIGSAALAVAGASFSACSTEICGALIAAVPVVAGLIYLATRPSKLPPPQPAPIAAVTPNPPAIATPTVEEKAPLTPQVAVQPTAQPTAPVAVAIPNPSISATPIPTLAQAQGYRDAKDFAKALPLLRKAADLGDAEAMYKLGQLYEYGNGVNQDYAQARQWYQKAAKAGDADAAYNLGRLYEHGDGVNQDYVQARKWYQKAADAGNMDAKEAFYHLGKGQ